MEVFWPKFENEAKATRHILQHAIEATGLTFEQIRAYQVAVGCSLAGLGAESDGGLRSALEHLEAAQAIGLSRRYPTMPGELRIFLRPILNQPDSWQIHPRRSRIPCRCSARRPVPAQ